MRLESVRRTTKTGKAVEFRSASKEEAQLMIDYLKRVCGETRFLLSEPEDVTFTPQGEEAFLSRYEESEQSLMLNAYVDGQLVGNGSFAPVSEAKRLAHRCSLGIALFRDSCGQGIGELMLSILIEKARECGFEIMELEAVAANEGALHLYEKAGFIRYGVRRNAFRYKDGTYADEVLMALELKPPVG